ncbi:MAG: NAD(P)-dependent oxidoreductase [Fuerstiella sp.]
MIPTPTSADDLDQLISEPSAAAVSAVAACDGRFAVLGAGGKMGLHLCLMLQRALRQLGRTEPVTAVSRFGSSAVRDRFTALGLDVLSADLSDEEAIRRLPPFENVFFLAGVKFGTSDRPELLHQMNVQMPQIVAARFQSSRIVALSTGCVYSFCTPESGGAKEDDETSPPGAYAQSCLGREAAFIDAAEKFGTRSALIRLNYSIDLRYGVLVDIARCVMTGQPVHVDTGHVNVIWQGDAIAHTLQALPRVSAPPFIVNVTGAEILSVREIAAGFGRLFQKPVRIEGTEQPSAWLSNPAHAHRLFGSPTVSVDQMMYWIVEWLQRGGEILGKPTHFGVRDGSY